MMAARSPANPLIAWNRLRIQLRQRRIALGLRQIDVAYQAAIGLRTLERWEAGGRGSGAEPGAFALFRWCFVLKIDLVAVTPDAEDATPPINADRALEVAR